MTWTEQVGIHDVDGVSMFCRTCGLGLDRILNGRVDSAHWTGRRCGISPLDLLRGWLRKQLYPGFECEQCVGQEWWQGGRADECGDQRSGAALRRVPVGER